MDAKRMQILTRLTNLELELKSIKKSKAYYKTLCRGGQKLFDINTILRREDKVYIKINQLKQILTFY